MDLGSGLRPLMLSILLSFPDRSAFLLFSFWTVFALFRHAFVTGFVLGSLFDEDKILLCRLLRVITPLSIITYNVQLNSEYALSYD